MTSRGIVVEGNYRIGERVLLVFDEASRRYLPTYRRRKDRKPEDKELIVGKDVPAKSKCTCNLRLYGETTITAGDSELYMAEVIFFGEKCNINTGDYEVKWTATAESGAQVQILSRQPYMVTIQASGCGYIKIKGVWEGPSNIKCEKELRVWVIGCRCSAEVELDKEQAGNGELVTATANIQFDGCGSGIGDDVTISWDVAITSCSGTCELEVVNESDTSISFRIHLEGDASYATADVCVYVEPKDPCAPSCQGCASLYVGCSCDVAVTVPNMIAPGLVYNGTIKGWYYDCSEAEKTPLSYWFHDCKTDGMGCGVEIFEDVEVSEDPPEHRITFGVNPDAGSGSVKFTGQIGSEGNVPFCQQTAHIVIDCCLKLAEDRIVILYTDPEDVETIGVNQEVYLWVDMVEDGGCPPFKWSFDGPGEFEVSEDTTSATYKAPDYDGYDTCAGAKVTIGVADACGSNDEVKMSINAIFTNQVAYRIAIISSEGPSGSWCNNCIRTHWKYKWHWLWVFTWGFDNYNCAGDFLSFSWGNNHMYCNTHSGNVISNGCDVLGTTAGRSCTYFADEPECCGLRSLGDCWGAFWSSICPGGPSPRQLWCATCGMVLDCRTELMKQLKCCPGALPD